MNRRPGLRGPSPGRITNQGGGGRRACRQPLRQDLRALDLMVRRQDAARGRRTATLCSSRRSRFADRGCFVPVRGGHGQSSFDDAIVHRWSATSWLTTLAIRPPPCGRGSQICSSESAPAAPDAYDRLSATRTMPQICSRTRSSVWCRCAVPTRCSPLRLISSASFEISSSTEPGERNADHQISSHWTKRRCPMSNPSRSRRLRRTI